MVYPTHGAGSLCSTGISSTSWSTIGYERRHDPLLGPMEVDAFARALLAGQPTVPRYFARMRPINQAGPPLLGGVVPDDRAARRRRAGRGRSGAARSSSTPGRPRPTRAERIPGSLSIPAGSSFGTWLGWVVDADRPIVLLVDDAGRPRRPRPPGDADRLRDDRRLRRRRASTRWRAVRPAGRGRRGLSMSTTWRAQLAAGGPEAPARHRRPPGVRVRGRPRARARSTSGPASCPSVLDALPRDRDDRHDLRQRLPLERRRVAAARRAGSSGSSRSAAASRTGRRAAIPSPTAPARTATRPGRVPRRRGPRRTERAPGREPARPAQLSRRGPRTARAPRPRAGPHRGRRRSRPPTRRARCPTRPLRWSPISRRSLASRTMNTSTTGSSRPCRFCEAMMTRQQVQPRDQHDQRPGDQHERVDREERPGVGEPLVDPGLPAERLADHERGRQRHDRRGQHARPEQPDREQRLGQPAGDRLQGLGRVGGRGDRPARDADRARRRDDDEDRDDVGPDRPADRVRLLERAARRRRCPSRRPRSSGRTACTA